MMREGLEDISTVISKEIERRIEEMAGAVIDDQRGKLEASRLLTETEASALLGIRAWTLAQIRKRDGIPHVRLGKHIRYDPEALRDWWRSQLQGG